MTSFRLRYVPGAHNDHFTQIRYPAPNHPGYPTMERAQQVLAAMPNPKLMEIISEED